VAVIHRLRQAPRPRPFSFSSRPSLRHMRALRARERERETERERAGSPEERRDGKREREVRLAAVASLFGSPPSRASTRTSDGQRRTRWWQRTRLSEREKRPSHGRSPKAGWTRMGKARERGRGRNCRGLKRGRGDHAFVADESDLVSVKPEGVSFLRRRRVSLEFARLLKAYPKAPPLPQPCPHNNGVLCRRAWRRGFDVSGRGGRRLFFFHSRH